MNNIDAGTSSVLTCLAYGDPLPTIAWTRDGGDLTNSTRITIFDEVVSEGTATFVKSTLQICSANESDTGHYTCLATGETSTDAASFVLQVFAREGNILHCTDSTLPLMYIFILQLRFLYTPRIYNRWIMEIP